MEIRPIEEIEAALMHCSTKNTCDGCPYVGIVSSYCQSTLMYDALIKIQMLRIGQANLQANVKALQKKLQK